MGVAVDVGLEKGIWKMRGSETQLTVCAKLMLAI
jgi:hypothetical protein